VEGKINHKMSMRNLEAIRLADFCNVKRACQLPLTITGFNLNSLLLLIKDMSVIKNPFSLLYYLVLIGCITTDACSLYRLNHSIKVWWICSGCETKAICCERLLQETKRTTTTSSSAAPESVVELSFCLASISTVPATDEKILSLYSNSYSILHSDTLDRQNVPSQQAWEIQSAPNEIWNRTAKSPFRGEKPFVHMVESHISEDRGMHRTVVHWLSFVEPGKIVKLFLFMTEQVYIDVEDLLDGDIEGGILRDINTAEIPSVELPSFQSPQYVVTLEIEVTNPYVFLKTKLHLRYLELAAENRTTILQLPHPMLWNSRGITPEPLRIENASTALERDAWLISTATTFLSILGAALLLWDYWKISRWQ
jgi:hypothetical protein